MSTTILTQKETEKTKQKREYVTVNVDRAIHKQLCKAGEKGQTFSEIIQNLLNERNGIRTVAATATEGAAK